MSDEALNMQTEREMNAWKALTQVYDFMFEDVQSGDANLWTIGYAELFDLVENTMSFCPEEISPSSRCSLPSGESDPPVTADYAGADTHALGRELAYWVSVIGDRVGPNGRGFAEMAKEIAKIAQFGSVS